MWPGVSEERARLVVANFNTHGGVDGWGRPFDLAAACRAIDADVIVLQEFFVPDEPARAPWLDLSGLEQRHLFHTELARARLLEWSPERITHPTAWGPRPRGREPRALRLEGPPPGRRRALHPGERALPSIPGSWGLAVLSREALVAPRVVELPRLRREAAVRKAIICTVELGGGRLTLAGTHLGHLTHGSPLQVAALRRELAAEEHPTVLLGDMNCWGPPLVAMLPGWQRAVRARTWPAWRPHSQIDHVLLRGGVRASSGAALSAAGSDHLPVRVELELGTGILARGTSPSHVERGR